MQFKRKKNEQNQLHHITNYIMRIFFILKANRQKKITFKIEFIKLRKKKNVKILNRVSKLV